MLSDDSSGEDMKSLGCFIELRLADGPAGTELKLAQTNAFTKIWCTLFVQILVIKLYCLFFYCSLEEAAGLGWDFSLDWTSLSWNNVFCFSARFSAFSQLSETLLEGQLFAVLSVRLARFFGLSCSAAYYYLLVLRFSLWWLHTMLLWATMV